ncbi:hypothetical protein OGR47_17510 [Methylocystis sp. MJC1]|uniref:hypothetical protein n=1 Tax=Methylocystis sp. MJC1 TaxID=2654282 RepID=UPI0013EC85E4|nr:hypothetical protein [Methylocystis sp. MJC1]KAF2990045.1 hypothetical protein MJC1_02962 [Methylocystis sp. MJC1]MBU6528755.1 hypothetical protein [Methylocystis sp. MJC1]UZX11641.1 hypothetical protein OGR47_17510 [Methylocystis sp. MJC1]
MSQSPSLADLSPVGRAAMALKRFQNGILKELDFEIANASDDGERAALDESKARLQVAVKQMTELAKDDERQRGIEILNTALDLMFASADAASRIDLRRIPKAISMAHGRPGGKVSARSRRDTAEVTWKPIALELAKEIRSKEPKITQVELAEKIEARWYHRVQKIEARLGRKIKCPKTQLIPALSKWEKNGELVKCNK